MKKRSKTSGILFLVLASVLMLPQVSNAQDFQEELLACVNALSVDPELARLKGKVGLSGVAEQTFEMKTNKAYPNAAERKAITLWVEKIRACSKITEKAVSDGLFQPAMIPLVKGLYPKFEQRALQLYNKKVTYGEFAQARDEDSSTFIKDVDNVNKGIAQQQDQEKAQVQQEREQRAQERERREQVQRQSQQEKQRNEANEKMARCQIARQNAMSFCNQGNQGVVVNVGPDSYSNSNSQGFMSGYTQGVNAGNCAQWSAKVNQECR